MSSSRPSTGARIKALREEQGLTQADIAKLRNITQSAVAKQETGDRDLGSDGLVWYSSYFDVTTDYLLGLTDNPRGHEQPATIAARPTPGMEPISQERLDEIIAEAVRKIREESGLYGQKGVKNGKKE